VTVPGRGSRTRVAMSAVALAVTFVATDGLTQTGFVDAAKRTVAVPLQVSRVFAAGAPAEVLLYTLAPEMLVGRNRLPEGEALEFFPPQYRQPVLIRQLPEVDNPAADAELLAVKPHLYVDYGTVNPDYVASVEAVQQRTRVPGIILDGSLARIPDTYRRLGAAMGIAERGERLGAAADRLLTTYRGALASPSSPLRVYLACSADGFLPCLADDSAGEQLAWLGGVNVAGTRATAPRRPLSIDEITAMAPQAIVVTGGPGAAARLRANPAWKSLRAVAAGRVYQWPALPYSWGARPPSVNRLPGLIWLAQVLRERPFDAQFDDEVKRFFREFYHLELTGPQLRTLVSASRPS
jgi:iron complex transport system substrate-binding protein